MSKFDDSSSEDEEYWETSAVYLRPGKIWSKPYSKLTVITQFTLPTGEETEGVMGSISAQVNGRFIQLCALIPSHPTQITKIVFNSTQDITLVNTGNHGVSMTYLTKHSELE